MSKSRNIKYLSFLQKLNEKKEILFGKFSDTLNRGVKQEEWEEMRRFCVAIGLITTDKDYIFVRNNTWGNLRKKTMKKMDLAKKTGAEGDPDQKLDELDLLVLDIVGRDSPVVQGLGVSDSMSAGPSNEIGSVDEEVLVEDFGDSEPEAPVKKRLQDIQQKIESKSYCKKRPVSADQFFEIQELKKKKLFLEVENLAMDLFMKEVASNMPPSKFTEHLHKVRPLEEGVLQFCEEEN